MNAIRVGAAFHAVSMAAGASVLMPYLSLIWSMVASNRVRLSLLFEAVEERQRVQPVGNEVVQLHADEIGVLVLRALGLRVPQAAQRGDERLIVLAFVELDLAAPAARGHAEAGNRRVLRARHRESNGKADVRGPQALRAQAHGGFVNQFVRHGPGLLRRCASPARARGSG